MNDYTQLDEQVLSCEAVFNVLMYFRWSYSVNDGTSVSDIV